MLLQKMFLVNIPIKLKQVVNNAIKFILTYFFFEFFKNQFIWWTIPLKTFISCIDVFALKIKFLNLLIFALEVCFKRYPTRKSISSISANVSYTSFDDAKLKFFNSLFKFFLEDLFNSYKTIETAWERFMKDYPAKLEY